MKIINRLFGTRYWYAVRFIYKNAKNERIFDFVREVGLLSKSTILNHRKIKKIITPLHKTPHMPKYLLRNGKFSIEVECYLGFFKGNKTKAK